MRRLKQRSLIRVVTMGSALFILGTALAATTSSVSAEQPILSRSTSIGIGQSVTQAKTAWSIPLAVFSETGWARTVAIAEEGRVFALIGSGQLAAYDGASGKRLWTYGKSLKPLLAYDQGTVYGLTAEGSIYAITSGGTRKWVSAIGAKGAERITVTGDTVYVTKDRVLYALERATGKLRWKVAEKREEFYLSGYPEVRETEEIVLRMYYVEGAHSSNQVNAYDKRTGKLLWRYSDVGLLLEVRDGLVYVTMDWFMIGDNDPTSKSLQIDEIELQTGKRRDGRVFTWNVQPDSAADHRFGGSGGSALIDGTAIYIFQDDVVAQYNFPAYEQGEKPVKQWKAPDPTQYVPLYKVHQGRLLYQHDQDHAIGMLKTVNGGFVRTPYGINVIQTDLYGNGLYLGLADGSLLAYDYAALKPIFSVKTSGRNFEPTLKSGGMLYVRSGGKLMAVKLPSNLATS
ncbi:PQQ-binding-like beta-propeller repeat protein [Paenibacillus aurantiacus]|uniref:PQQ-binding-like beta-propeller repeat protein n=1 Tax=Paenibacillus aurantiacus TaxID=1936118 RepID=A0ABV5KV33_9BACL